MTYIDTHCHLDSILKKTGLESYEALKSAHFPPEFEACITISCDPHSPDPVLALIEEPGVYGAFGIHPHDAKHYQGPLEEKLKQCVSHPKAVAWGEIGLDYHYTFSEPEVQKEVFIRQLKVAQKLSLPLVVHTREAEDDTLEILKSEVSADWKIHVHCFTDSPDFAGNLLDSFSNLYLGFTGVITFKNADRVQEVVRLTPIERMLLETDGPYLAPMPHRGTTAHPGYIPFIAAKIAELKAVPLEHVYSRIRQNTRSMYGF